PGVRSRLTISASTTRPVPRRSIQRILAIPTNCRTSLPQEVPNDRVEEIENCSVYVDRRFSWIAGSGPAYDPRFVQRDLDCRGDHRPSAHALQLCRSGSAYGATLRSRCVLL